MLGVMSLTSQAKSKLYGPEKGMVSQEVMPFSFKKNNLRPRIGVFKIAKAKANALEHFRFAVAAAQYQVLDRYFLSYLFDGKM